ncbi:28S ribosomal protein S18b, mitochondrial [Halotydeus destructor]|nr:28S ribosomal protein S18b, mitochondrial [Halotydeus destructor]
MIASSLTKISRALYNYQVNRNLGGLSSFSGLKTFQKPRCNQLCRSHARKFSDDVTQTSDEDAELLESMQDTSQLSTQIMEGLGQNIMGNLRRPKGRDKMDKSRDRRVPVPLEVALRYMDSQAYATTYGQRLVWHLYRRNHKGLFHVPPAETRRSCVGEDGFITSGSPCPICRDEYFLLHHENVKLLKQFIDQSTGTVYAARKTNLCMVKHEELLVAIYKAKDYGTLSFHIPTKVFDYKDYYAPELLKEIELPPEYDYEADEMIKNVKQSHEFGDHRPYAIENFP